MKNWIRKFFFAFFVVFISGCCPFCLTTPAQDREVQKQKALDNAIQQLEPIAYKRPGGNVEFANHKIGDLDTQHTLKEFLVLAQKGSSKYLRVIDDKFIEIRYSNYEHKFTFNPSSDATEKIPGAIVYLKRRDDPVFAQLLDEYPGADHLKGRKIDDYGNWEGAQENLYILLQSTSFKRIVVGDYLICFSYDKKLRFVSQDDKHWRVNYRTQVTMEQARFVTPEARRQKREDETEAKKNALKSALEQIIGQVQAKLPGTEVQLTQVEEIELLLGKIVPIGIKTVDELVEECVVGNEKTYVIVNDYLVCLDPFHNKVDFIKRESAQITQNIDEANAGIVQFECTDGSYRALTETGIKSFLWIGTDVHALRMVEGLKFVADVTWANRIFEFEKGLLDRGGKPIYKLPQNACGLVGKNRDLRNRYITNNSSVVKIIDKPDEFKQLIKLGDDQNLSPQEKAAQIGLSFSYKSMNLDPNLRPIHEPQNVSIYLFCNDEAAEKWSSGNYSKEDDAILKSADGILCLGYRVREGLQGHCLISTIKRANSELITNMLYGNNESAKVKITIGPDPENVTKIEVLR